MMRNGFSGCVFGFLYFVSTSIGFTPTLSYAKSHDIIKDLKSYEVLLAASSAELRSWKYYGSLFKRVNKNFCEQVTEIVQSIYYNTRPVCTKDIYDESEWNQYPNGEMLFRESTKEEKRWIKDQIRLRASSLCRRAGYDYLDSNNSFETAEFKIPSLTYLATFIDGNFTISYQYFPLENGSVVTSSLFAQTKHHYQEIPHWKFKSVKCAKGIRQGETEGAQTTSWLVSE